MIKRFNRFELKYIVTAEQHAAIARDLRANMRLDTHGPDGSYAITSLYYDTADLAFMRAKVEGIKFRRKLRIRRYGPDGDGPVFVEIKQRINRTTQKRRVALSLADAYAMCEGHFSGQFADEKDAQAAGEIVFLARGLDLQPTCLVGYQRQAFVGGDYEPGLRLTFDTMLWAALPGDGMAVAAERHALISPSFMVMEVKANEAVPLWMANLLARHQCALQRYSKYCASVALLLNLGLMSPGQKAAVFN